LTVPDGNVEGVRAALDGAVEVTSIPDPGGPAGPSRERRSQLPEDCPVEPLGILDDVAYYLDDSRQLRALPAREHSRLGVQALFGTRIELLYRDWPRVNAEGETTGWRPEKAAEALMTEAARRGVWNPMERVRGVGCWLGAAGNLILHCGDQVWVGPGGADAGGWRQPGPIDAQVYPAAPARPRFAPTRAAGGERGPAHELLALLNTWRWRRGAVDAQLLLGWIAAAMLGGALQWRPMAWITGDRATGKSTLHRLLQWVFDDAIVSVSDASGAGIWQKLGHAALPVAIDELEADEDNRRAYQIVKLARQAASGGVVLRGGADHKGAEFTARSCFLFSSILIPPMLGQDRSRIAILELEPLVAEGEVFRGPPALDRRKLAALGAALRRRLVDGWHRWDATLEAYRQACAAAGQGGRGADQLGTLGAAADLLLHDQLPSGDELEAWAAGVASASADTPDDADHQRCVAHLVTSVVDVYRGGARLVLNQWLLRAAGDARGLEPGSQVEAVEVIGTFGLRIHRDAEGQRWLAVANCHQGLAALFAGTHWAARSGAAGVWAQALRRVPGARSHGGLRFNGAYARCTLLPLEAVLLSEEGGDHAP
jgi:hypothetical protein